MTLLYILTQKIQRNAEQFKNYIELITILPSVEAQYVVSSILYLTIVRKTVKGIKEMLLQEEFFAYMMRKTSAAVRKAVQNYYSLKH